MERDAGLPYVVEMAKNDTLLDAGIDIEGAVIFHTAVSYCGNCSHHNGQTRN